ncbi:biotin-[acetyl-CoA-carboxylase] ligase [Synechococcus sp. PCC 7335]|uniref:biotin--[acetyl-CoA-carboxylase] ligase n=1 Tax=Synechococcus sp. (strain ATCC 29403 / PCC 7335) TaxID=91464 RepID=UPI00017EBFE1|nr:biotin--[acetyl-CoA-carboxylase] ligase [Synechococcus sp. PCC 7335]EDX87443.1 biotin-[acetyl-CoA-carboxylase] ligase [Synechococcus sp. PCC 7335]
MKGTELGIYPEFSRIRPKFDIHLFETLTSTNTHLWEMLKASNQSQAKAGTVVIAAQQSSGRGQRDRIWQSDPGGLYLSLALEPDWPIAYSAQLTCISAWGIAIALNNLGIPIQIKWPNDLFYQGQKLGGILTETKLSQPSAIPSNPLIERHKLDSTARIRQAVIGVGLNWHNLVPQSGITLTKILESGLYRHAQTKIDCLETLIVVVLRGILQGYFYQQRVGSQVFMKTYQKLLTQVGKPVSLKNGTLKVLSISDLEVDSRRVYGRVIGVSEEGYLQVAMQKQGASLTSKGSSARAKLHTANQNAANQSERILLIRPSEIHI